MHLTAEKKKQIFKTHGKSEKNTGAAESQIALFTERINYLTGHLKTKPKYKVSEYSLVALVGKRKSLLDYLRKNHIDRYRAILKELDIRK